MTNIIATTGLLGSVEPHLLSPLPLPARIELLGRILLYSFGGCKQAAVKRFMVTIPFNYPAWKKTFRSNGALHKNGKLYAYCQITGPIGPKEAGISLKESNAIKLALKYRPLYDYLQNLHVHGRRAPLSLAKMDAYFARVIQSDDLQQYIAKFAYRKLRFLAQSYGTTLGDLRAAMANSAYGALLKQYPNFENFAHLTKLAKVAVHNCGMNIIKRETSQKRNVLEQNSDGTYYKNTTTLTPDNQSAVSIGEEGYTLTSYLVTGIDGAVFSEWERNFSLKQLLTSPQLTADHKRFLRLMLGEHDEDFANFMERSASALYERDFEEYQRQACAFIGISLDRGKKFLVSLQQFL